MVTFDGPNKIIIMDNNITDITVKEIYSEWKDWVLLSDNSKYLEAMRVVGGDPITDIISLGSTFFLSNGWKIRPYEGNHTLNIEGNLFTDDGLTPFVQSIGNYNILISMNRSNLIDTVSTGGGTGGLTTAEHNKLMAVPDIDDISAITETEPSIELSSIPPATASLKTMVQFLFQYFRNLRTVSSTQEKMYKDNGTQIGAANVSDDGTTFTKGRMQ